MIALIFGITGQDGSYLSELLLEKGYEVHGVIRRCSSFNTKRIDHIFDKLILHYGDVIDSSSICSLISEIKPTEIYNLAAQSHVKVSFELPEYTADVTGIGTLRILEAIKMSKIKNVKFYNASTSELFGKVKSIPQNEDTPFYPVSPYAIAKLYSHYITINYRESYNMFCVNGILFNHESPRRGETFVTRKITRGIARIRKNLQNFITLGNIDTYRDWGHAKDYVYAMYLMLQENEPQDFVICSSENHSVREFCEISFSFVGIYIKWIGEGINEVGICQNNKIVINKSNKYFRKCEVNTLLGDFSKAKKILKWEPTYNFTQLIYEMLKYDFENYNIPIDDYETCLKRYENYKNTKVLK
ncbi:GDP-mannose 4,6-dehydratase, putative [Plasmodium relictum]|uniref:GDP-mannose 4,6-dehydratase n=1 Tax=Plasmodium relictum TaxID=85471 RepID=A0A1J1HEM1_PLARL|nr:GDP-mannose 4,6-dehydratase, putative [Plasmodium relictum]CRH02506.1 GDP-mannose 4,6-dehydratase, putative [Plasmodium relictum]